MTKIWVLWSMKKIGLEVEHISDTYIKEIRSVLELAVPVWHGGLTRKLSGDIERIKKVAFKVIMTIMLQLLHAHCWRQKLLK